MKFRNQTKLTLIIFAFCIMAFQVSAADIKWQTSNSSTLNGTTNIIVSGDFSIGAIPIGFAQIDKIDFYIDGVFIRTERYAPYWLYGDYGSGTPYKGTIAPGNHNLLVNVYSNGIIGYSESINLVPQYVAPPPPPVIPPATTNILSNSNFLSGLTSWGYHNSNYVTWNSAGKNDAGSFLMTPNYGGVSEAWTNRISVHPGDKVIYEGWFKAGPIGSKRYNNGTGLGFDVRQIGSDAVIYVNNGPATVNQYWTYLYSEFTIPCKMSIDSPYSTYSVSSGHSSTGGGARSGVSAEFTGSVGQNMPYDLQITPWIHIWHLDTVTSAWFDNLKLNIVKGAVKC